MPRRTTVQRFPFLEGQHQEIDPKLLPDGYLSACKNVRLRKDGRFGVRADFDSVTPNRIQFYGDFIPYDVIGFDDGLYAIADMNGLSQDTVAWDLASFSGENGTWSGTTFNGSSSRVSRASGLRNLGGIHSHDSITRFDCAAANGLVCLVAETDTISSPANSIFVRVFEASNGADIYQSSIATGARMPRVVAVGAQFFIFLINSSDQLELRRFDPSNGGQVTVTVTTGMAGAHYDAVADFAQTGCWVAVNKTAPTTTLIPIDSLGVSGTTITGPAVLYDYVTILETETRVHLLSVLAAGTCQLRTYTAGALTAGPTTLGTAVDRQPGLSDATFNGIEEVCACFESTGTPNRVDSEFRRASTHAVGLFGGQSQHDTLLGTKPIPTAANGYHQVFGGVSPDGAFYSNFLEEAHDRYVLAYKDKFAAALPNVDTTPQIAKDTSTGKFYWPSLIIDSDGKSAPRVTEFTYGGHPRMQTAQIASELYLAGGFIGLYDKQFLMESGFFGQPRILSATPSNGAGALPSSTTLLVSATWEYTDAQDRFHESEIAVPTTVTMGAADDTIAVVVSVPKSLRTTVGAPQSQGLVTLVVWRSVSGLSQLRRAESVQVTQGQATYTVTLLLSDATVRANGVIYTQAGRAALGTILPNEAPLTADFIWKFGSRLLAANADGAQVSKEIFPGRPAEWSGSVGFTIPQISERITGVAALDQRGFLCTAERFYTFSGDGPNDAGEGRYSEPLPVPGSTGLLTWQSLVETPLGLFFQGSNGQLWVLPRDGSAPHWIGQPVRDVLVAFPTVTAAVLLVKEQLVSFTCNNSGATDSRVVSYDLRAKTWIVDEFTSPTPIISACSYQGRLAYISGGVVYTEKTSLTPATFIEHGLTTGTVSPFDWGKICRFGCIGEYRGDCDLYARISYDDGKSFTTLTKIQELRAANYAVGDTVDVEWTPARWKSDGFRLDFSARTPGTPSEGFIFNEYWIEYLTARGTARRATAQRG